MERQCQGTKRKREDGEQQPNKAAKFKCFNCGGVGHRARDCPTPINKGNFKYHLKLRKCEFFMEQMEFLGYTIDREGIRPNKNKIKAILDMLVPKTKTNVKSFLGLGSYYRRFIKNFVA
jgi:hypothetical protein